MEYSSLMFLIFVPYYLMIQPHCGRHEAAILMMLRAFFG